MRVGAEAEQHHVEARQLLPKRLAKLSLVVVGAGVRAALGEDPLDRRSALILRGDPVQQGLLRQPVVGQLVVGRHAALVAEPERCPRPVHVHRGQPLVRDPRGAAAGERYVRTGGRRGGEPAGALPGGVLQDERFGHRSPSIVDAADSAGP